MPGFCMVPMIITTINFLAVTNGALYNKSAVDALYEPTTDNHAMVVLIGIYIHCAELGLL